MPPIAPASHLTSCIFVRAAVFGGESSNTSALVRVSVISDRFARFMPPNFCVQLANNRHAAIRSTELALFLHPAMRNSLTMCFVFNLRVRFADVHSGDELKSLFLLMRSKLVHINSMSMEFMPSWWRRDFIYSLDVRSAMLSALPPALQFVTLTFSESENIDLSAGDILTLSVMPHLRELRLCGKFQLSADGFVELFRPASSSSDSSQVFFRQLRWLEANCARTTLLDLLRAASKSRIVPQLIEFAVQPNVQHGPLTRVNVSELNELLKCLSHVRALGGGVLSNMDIIGGPLDVSPLQHVREVTSSFLSSLECNGFPLDLSAMTGLEVIGWRFLYKASNVSKLVLPPNLRSASGHMASFSGITELDFSPVASTLTSIDVAYIASYSRIVRFDTTPLRGKVVGTASSFLFGCSSLTEVDLSGVCIAKIGTCFLNGCGALVAVRGMEGLAQTIEVGSYFIRGSFSLTECDVSQMASLRKVGDFFLDGSPLEARALEIVQKILETNNSEAIHSFNRRSRDE